MHSFSKCQAFVKHFYHILRLCTEWIFSSRPRNIQWSRINDSLPERAEISGPTLQISRLSQSHNGTYLCQAQNNFGRAADHYTLLVYGESVSINGARLFCFFLSIFQFHVQPLARGG